MPRRVHSRVPEKRFRLGHFVLEFLSPATIYSLRNAGFDFVVFDMEHSGKGFSDLAFPVALTRALGLGAIVRIPNKSADYISRALDIGATGILVPMVETKAEAAGVVAAALYAPLGRRGVALQIAHDEYRGGDAGEKLKGANARTEILLQIESVKGADNVDAIAGTPGVGGIWIGHYDLSVSQGIPGQFQDARFTRAVARIENICNSKKVDLARLGGTVDECVDLVQRGYRHVAFSGDIWALQASLVSASAAIRSCVAVPKISPALKPVGKVVTQ